MSVLKPLTELNISDYWKEVKDEDALWGDLKREVILMLKKLLEGCMDLEISSYVGAKRYQRDGRRRSYRNGSYERTLDTELGVIESLRVPRARDSRFRTKVFRRYKRRQPQVNQTIKCMFIDGVSTRRVQEVLRPLIGEKICSATTVSNICKQLDKEVDRFHNRELKDEYVYLFLDGIYLSRKEAIGAKKRPVLVAYGIKRDGSRELIDFRLANKESETEWRAFLNNLYNRGLRGDRLKLIITDGDKGLGAALEEVYPWVERQLCWVHKMRNVMCKVRKLDRDEVKAGAVKIYLSSSRRKAIKSFWDWSNRWCKVYPQAVKCIGKDLDRLISFYRLPRSHWIKIRTINVIERIFRDVRKRTRSMSAFNDPSSCQRIVYALFHLMNQRWKDKPLKEFCQNKFTQNT